MNNLSARLTLPELNRRLLAEQLVALVVVPAAFDPDETEQHFADSATRANGWSSYPNGSLVRIVRGRVGPHHIAGLAFDLAVVLAPVEPDTLNAIRSRLLARGGALFVPFAPEVP